MSCLSLRQYFNSAEAIGQPIITASACEEFAGSSSFVPRKAFNNDQCLHLSSNIIITRDDVSLSRFTVRIHWQVATTVLLTWVCAQHLGAPSNMMRPTMGGGGRVRKHSICRQVVPLPVAVSLCVTCFMFGLFWGKTVPTAVQETVRYESRTPTQCSGGL